MRGLRDRNIFKQRVVGQTAYVRLQSKTECGVKTQLRLCQNFANKRSTVGCTESGTLVYSDEGRALSV